MRTSAPPRRLTSDACAACSGRPREPGQPSAVLVAQHQNDSGRTKPTAMRRILAIPPQTSRQARSITARLWVRHLRLLFNRTWSQLHWFVAAESGNTSSCLSIVILTATMVESRRTGWPFGLVAFATMAGLAGCGDAVLPPMPSAPTVDPRAGAIKDLVLNVRHVAGPSLRECGVFLSGDGRVSNAELERAVSCGVRASAERAPFWLALEDPGQIYFHSIHVQGLLAGGDGVPHRFTYESTLPLTTWMAPVFTAAPCPHPSASSTGVRCQSEP